VLRPDVHMLAWDDFDRTAEAIAAGAAAARRALPRIRQMLTMATASAPLMPIPDIVHRPELWLADVAQDVARETAQPRGVAR